MALAFFKHKSVQILFVCGIYLAFAPFLPLKIHQILYAVSLLIKDLLLWSLPLTVGFFIAHAIASFKKKAPLFILTLFLFEGISNWCSVWYSFGCAHLISSYLPNITPCDLVDTFYPLFRLPLHKPFWWSADKGTLAGIALGLIATFRFPFLYLFIEKGKKMGEIILTNFFSRLIPLFILGFIARMYKTFLLEQMILGYVDFFLYLILFLIFYICLLFFVGAGFSRKIFLKNMKNLIPAGAVAFSSGCSLSTMPWTIDGTCKNLKNPDFAKSIIPATTNIQQIGDCIANSFLCSIIYLHFNGSLPPLIDWTFFSLAFVLARFATAAVMGGAIFIMLPIYEYYLSFTPEMIAIILTFNLILDPLITCSNVVANGALCTIFEQVWIYILQKFSPRKKIKATQ
jgi:hypothetical protein